MITRPFYAKVSGDRFQDGEELDVIVIGDVSDTEKFYCVDVGKDKGRMFTASYDDITFRNFVD